MKKFYIIIYLSIIIISIRSNTLNWISYPENAYLSAGGGAFLLERNSNNLFYNPSVLVLSNKWGVNFSSGVLAFGRIGSEIGAYYKIRNDLALFIGGKYYLVSGFVEANNDGEKTGKNFSISRFLAISGFSFRFGHTPLTFSFLFKLLNENYYIKQAMGYGIKLNMSLFLHNFSLGIFADNIVQVVNWDDYEDTYPFNFGLIVEKNIKKVKVGLVLESDTDFNINYRVGINYKLNDKISLSLGSMNENISLGFQYILNKKWQINYAAQIEKHFLGLNNMITLSFH